MASDTGRRLGELLVEAHAAKPEDVEAAAAEGRRDGRLMAEILQERFGVDEHEIVRALSRKYGLEYALADDLLEGIDSTLAGSLPHRFCEFNRLIPIRREGDTVIMATCDPLASCPELPHALAAAKLDLRLITPTDYHRLRAALDLHQLGQDARQAEPKPNAGLESAGALSCPSWCRSSAARSR